MAARIRRRGEGAPLGDQESVGGDPERRVMMEAAPAASFVMPEAEFLFQVLVVALDPPAQFDQIDKCPPGDLGGRVESQYLPAPSRRWAIRSAPFFGARRRPVVIAVRGTDPHGGEARSEFRVAALRQATRRQAASAGLSPGPWPRPAHVHHGVGSATAVARVRSRVWAATVACPAARHWCDTARRQHRPIRVR